MARYARLLAGVVQEIIDTPPGKALQDLLHPDLAAQCVPVDNTVQQNYSTVDGSTFSPPPPPPASAAVPTTQQIIDAIQADPNAPLSIFARGLVILLANRFSLTPAQVVTAIRNAAT